MRNPDLFNKSLQGDLTASNNKPRHGGQVSLRKFPYPFRAALTICSDIDHTTTLDRFLNIQNYLNKQTKTCLGIGIGLEIGNSFFPYTPDDSFSFFSSRREDQEVILTLIKAGFIDCIHSYGDGITNRGDVIRALEAFESAGANLDVWIDHSRAPSNFGKDTTQGEGDILNSPIYHADVTLKYGIKFIWKGRGSSIIGHGVPFSFQSFIRIFDKNYPVYTGVNIAKEITKTILAYAGNKRFAIHRGNSLLRVTHLKDGQRVYEFQRCNNYWQGLSYGHDSVGLAYIIRPIALSDLTASEGTMIIYTHLGVGSLFPPYIAKETQYALRCLANAYHTGDIYITTTSRLLNYSINRSHLKWSFESLGNNSVCIVINGVEDPIFGLRKLTKEEAQGITFYVPDRQNARIFLAGEELSFVERNPTDHTGRESVSIPRNFLSYPL